MVDGNVKQITRLRRNNRDHHHSNGKYIIFFSHGTNQMGKNTNLSTIVRFC